MYFRESKTLGKARCEAATENHYTQWPWQIAVVNCVANQCSIYTAKLVGLTSKEQLSRSGRPISMRARSKFIEMKFSRPCRFGSRAPVISANRKRVRRYEAVRIYERIEKYRVNSSNKIPTVADTRRERREGREGGERGGVERGAPTKWRPESKIFPLCYGDLTRQVCLLPSYRGRYSFRFRTVESNEKS